ncbi:unnamed protein product, partial [Linum tenue]
MKVNSGSEYSTSEECTSSTCRRSIPLAAMSRAVTLCPACFSSAITLYQHQAPWPAPWTSTKCLIIFFFFFFLAVVSF